MSSVADIEQLLRDTTLLDIAVDVKEELRRKFLAPSNALPWDLLDVMQEVPAADKTIFYDSLVQLPLSISRSQYRLKRKGIKGEVVNYEEKLNHADLVNSQAANSISLKRQYAAKEHSFRGSTSNLPFQPGGGLTVKDNSQKVLLHRDQDGLFDIGQGLSRGLNIRDDSHLINEELEELERDDDDSSDKDTEHELVRSEVLLENIEHVASSANGFEKEIDELLPVDINFGRSLYKPEPKPRHRDWAHVVDLNHKIENFEEMIPNMARQWPFSLDTFQQEAIFHLEQGDSVFVAAHTSAGKTVIAEYAIAMANRNMTKAIYTSPIKALSNQKFRDFKQTFKEVDVGLVTGDVQINPEANCLIMTTEILRSMLYRGADLIRDVEFVIFDEVHYVNDIDRGVVWEEVIIMLPDHVKFILLSATVPNTFEFANWVGRTKHKDIYVISTPKRPVPLEISIWGKNKLMKIIDAERTFLDKNFNEYLDLYEGKKQPTNGGGSGGQGGNNSSRGGRGGNSNSRGGRGGNRGGRGGNQNSGRGNFNGRGGGSGGAGQRQRFNQVSRPNKNTWIELVQFLNSNTLLPAVIFVFSKKRCEEYAQTLTGIDFCNSKEKSQIHMFIDKAVARLKKEDRDLPQILTIRDMLSRGIAVHHGGLLPIVKEVIEILFAKTLVKVLFATETFAMGLNLPTRTVVFSEIRKHDGVKFRDLLPGEFTQMSGRAGRRGLDPTGTVIIMSYTEPLSKLTLKDVMLGTPTKLVSQFRLTYNMILNLLRIEALRVEEMIKHSFGENTSQTLLPEHQKQIEVLEQELHKLPGLPKTDEFSQEQMEDIFSKLMRYKELTTTIVKEYNSHAVLSKKLKAGRLLIFKDVHKRTRIGFIVRPSKGNTPDDTSFVVLTFDMGEAAENDEPSGLPFISRLKHYYKHNFKKIVYRGGLKIAEVSINDIELVGRASAKVLMNKIIQSDPEEIENLKKQLNTLLRFQDMLDEMDNTGFSTIKLHEALKERSDLVSEFSKNDILKSKDFKQAFKNMYERHEVESKVTELRSLISEENLELLPDYEQRLEVLKSLGFVDQNLNVVLKGRVACEINCGWELVLTELVLNNFLGDFESEEIVALLSAFVYEGKTSDEPEAVITPRLEKGQKKINEIISNVFKVYDEYQVELTSEESDFFERKRFALVNVVYEWARGLSFKEIMELSVEAEGTIVRVITRLDEVCREVKSAALIIGDSALHSKMTHAQELIKRDIVFCASLYL